MLTPDPNVLAASLTRIASPYLSQSPDAGFRTQLLRTTLRIEASPTSEAVESYHSHLLAEIEMIASSITIGKNKPALQAVDGPSPASPTSSPTKGAKGEVMCKYFVKAGGCRRGAKCPYSHDMGQLSRDQRSKKCLLCGSEAHRKRDCPTGEAGAKGSGKRDEGSTRAKSTQPSSPPTSPISGQPVVAAQVVNPAELTSPVAVENASQGMDPPMSIENLIKIAQQIVQGQGSSSSISTAVTESSSASLRVMTVTNPVHNNTGAVVGASGLVDSGATHPLRKATSSDEWDEASPVSVSLAGNQVVDMRMTPSGTLLLPVSELGSTTILPVGELIRTLGYRLDWSRKQCRLIAPDGEALKLSMRDGCPQLPEYQALSLIGRLEEQKLSQLKHATIRTEELVKAAALSMEKTWFRSLIEHCEGDIQAGNRAVDHAPFLKDLPWEMKSGLITNHSGVNGWELLKKFTCWSRAYRRRLHKSSSWVIHLYSGKCPNGAFRELDSGNNVVVNIDILKSSQLNVDDNHLWSLLSWACACGKVSAIIGGPPCKTFSRLRHRKPGPVPVRTRQHLFGWEGQPEQDYETVVKDTRLFIRMLWLQSTAVAGRVVNPPNDRQGDPSVAFVLEQPADPQGYVKPGDPDYNQIASFWVTQLWQIYA